MVEKNIINPLNAELNPIYYLLALLGAHHFLHVSRIRVNYIKAPKLSWFGHMQRMPDTTTVKKIFNLLAPEFYIQILAQPVCKT